MRTKAEIELEIKALKRLCLRIGGRFSPPALSVILIALEELQDGFDFTSDEWCDLTEEERITALNTRYWKMGTPGSLKPSEELR